MDSVISSHRRIQKLKERIRELKAENDHLYKTIARQSFLLTGVANGLRGPPEPLSTHDHSRLPELARQVRKLGVRSVGKHPNDVMVLKKLKPKKIKK